MRQGKAGILAGWLFCLSSPVSAQVYLNLTPVENDVRPGDRLQITGRLVNNTAETYFLTGGSGTITGGSNTDLNWDDLDFQNSLPVSLSPGAFYENFLYLDAAPDAPESDFTALYTVTAEFGDPAVPVDISSSVRVHITPAPSSSLILACGLVGIWGMRRRGRTA
jgi:hypothetical protein